MSSYITLKPQQSTGHFITSAVRGAYYDPQTADWVDAGASKQYYPNIKSGLVNGFVVVNASGYCIRSFIDFPISSGFLDTNQYTIDYIELDVKARQRLYADGAWFPYTDIPAGTGYALTFFDLNACYDKRLSQTIAADASGLFTSFESGGSIALSTSTNPAITSTEGIKTIRFNDTAWFSRILSTYQHQGRLSIGLKMPATASSKGVEYPVTDGRPNPAGGYSAQDGDPSYYAMCGWESEEEYLPALRIYYKYIESPPTLEEASVGDARSQYHTSLPFSVLIKDTEPTDLITFNISGCYDLGGGIPPSSHWTQLYSTTLYTNISGVVQTDSININSILPSSNIIPSATQWVYWNAKVPIYNGYWVSDTMSPSTMPSGPFTYIIESYPSGFLPTGVYNAKVSTQYNSRFEAYQDGLLLYGATGTNINFNFTYTDGVLDFKLTNLAGAFNKVNSVNVSSLDQTAMIATLSLKMTASDNDGADNYILPSSVLIDNRFKNAVTIVADTAGVTDREFGTIDEADFHWSKPTPPAGLSVSGYYYSLSTTQYPILASGDSFLPSGQSTVNMHVIAPGEGKWYLAVAPMLNTGLVGPVSSFGFYFNNPVNFERQYIYVNGTAVSSGSPVWVPNKSTTAINWSGYNAAESYELECGRTGTVVGKTLTFPINWSHISGHDDIAYFKLSIKDNIGYEYVSKNTEIDVSGWEYYSTGLWNNFSGDNRYGLRDTDATLVRYTLSDEDSVPERISLEAMMRIGYFDGSSSAIFQYQDPTDPVMDYFGDSTYTFGDAITFTLAGMSGTEQGLVLEIQNTDTSWRQYTTESFAFGFYYEYDGWRRWTSPKLYIPEDSLDCKIMANANFQVKPNQTYNYRLKLLGESTYFKTGTFSLSSNPDALLEWHLVDPEIDASGVLTGNYGHNAPLQGIGETYYARLRVWDGLEYGNWSPIYKFRVNTPPSVPSNLRIA